MGYNSSAVRVGTPLISYAALVGWCTTFAVIAVAIVIGNVLTIAVFRWRRPMRTRANYFLITLAIADIMVGIVSMPVYMYYLVCYWRYGGITRNTAYFLYMAEDMFSGFASIFALTVIAVERAYSVIWPFKHRMVTKRVYFTLIALVWGMSGILAFLYFLDAYKILRNRIFFYLIITLLFTSLLIICLAYFLIWIKAKFRKFRDETTCQIHGRASEHDRKLLATLLIVTCVFVVTWVPFHIVNIVVFVCSINSSCGSYGTKNIPFAIYTLIKLLHYSNSLVNPIVYSFTLPNFKNTILVLIGRRSPSFARSFRVSTSRRTDVGKLELKKRISQLTVVT